MSATAEPCFATEVDWLLCDALARLAPVDGESTYLRLSTRPIDQQPSTRRSTATAKHDSATRSRRRLPDRRTPGPEPTGCHDRGHRESWCPKRSPRLRSWTPREWTQRLSISRALIGPIAPGRVAIGRVPRAPPSVRRPSHLHMLVPASERSRPIVSVHDAASHSLAWLGSAIGVPQVALGVDRFGESGTISDLHEITGISTGNIVNAALIAIHEADPN